MILRAALAETRHQSPAAPVPAAFIAGQALVIAARHGTQAGANFMCAANVPLPVALMALLRRLPTDASFQ